MTKRICVYCGSSGGNRASYAQGAIELGRALVRRGYGLVYGGAHVGLMGTIADAVLDAGGEVDGVIPAHLMAKEIAHPRLTRLHVVETMHQRKLAMADLAMAFIALPGGLGTVEEMTESGTWTQLGLHAKPVGLLDLEGYWQPFLSFLDHAMNEGFLRPADRALWVVGPQSESLLDALETWQPPSRIKRDPPEWR